MLDVLFLCEGTYPYVPGGVSSWIHSLITNLPELTFGIVYLHTQERDELRLRYQLPPNLRELVVFHLYDMVVKPQEPATFQSDAWEDVAPFLNGIIRGEAVGFEKALRHLCGNHGAPPTLGMKDLATSYQAWEMLTEAYRQTNPKASFNDFFWSWRYAFLPLFKLFHAEVPEARLYHTVTTGWSGLLAAIASAQRGRPYLVTEHGLYVNERRIEISQADWIYVDAPTRGRLEVGLGTFKEIWIHLFLALGKVCYNGAAEVLTLFEGNRARQIEFGAPAEKIRVIPNGVDVEAFAHPSGRALPESSAFRVGLVGRVVPIKDVKTFIKACRHMAGQIPELEVYICGPDDENPEYYSECETLVDALGLRKVVTFTGRVDVRRYYPCLDVQVLTSISEGQPLAIIEGFCAGLPCVASDVGACSELILGATPEDRALGPAGIVTWVGNPRQTAEAVISLYRDPPRRQAMSLAARQRAQAYYRHSAMIEAYREIYQKYLTVAPPVSAVEA